MEIKRPKIKVNDIEEAISRLLHTDSFFAVVIASITRRPVDAKICPTMAVCCNPEERIGIEMIYNPEFIESIDDLALFKFFVEHECTHIIQKHIKRFWDDERVKSENHSRFNIGADMATNSAISAHYDSDVVDVIKSKYWMPEKKDFEPKLSMEMYIQMLSEDEDFEEQQVNPHLWGYKVDPGNCEGEGEGEGEGGKLVPITDGDLAESTNNQDMNLNDFVRDCIEKFEASRGSLPGYLQDLLEGFKEVKTKISWQQILQSRVKTGALAKRVRTIRRPNRRLHGFPGIIPFPGVFRDHVYRITMILDVSGSVTNNDVMAAFGVLKSLKEHMSNVAIHFVQADTEVKSTVEMRELADFDFNIHGRGGTDFCEPLREVEEKLKPDIILYFTDGWGPCPIEPPSAEIIWFITPQGQHPCEYSGHPKKYGEEIRLDYN